jgi:hypothetical protein
VTALFRRGAAAAAALSLATGLIAAPAQAATASPWHLYTVPVKGQATLDAIVSLQHHDAWAAGFTITPSAARPSASKCADVGFLDSLLLHWNGQRWQRVTVPDLGRINEMSAASPTDIWAAADCGVLHWNGRRWAAVAYPRPHAQQVSAASLVADRPGDTWLLGATYNSQTEVAGVFMDRWNGRSWRRIPLPVLGSQAGLAAVAAQGQGSAWTVGSLPGGPATPGTFILLHWNGRTWQRTTPPKVSLWTKFLNAVTILSARNVWAVGWGKPEPEENQPRHPIALHWNGRRWSSAPVPSGRGELYQVTPAGRQLWACGDTFSPDATSYAMELLRLSGGRWVRSPVPLAGEGSLFGEAAAPGGRLWVVGATGANRPVLALRS